MIQIQKRLLLIDTETGGLDPLNHSLLTGYMAIVHPVTLEIEAEIEFKHKDSLFRVTPEALLVNKIDLQDLSSTGEKTHVLHFKLYKWIEDICIRNKYILHPLGQNVKFDLDFMHNNFPDVSQYINRRVVDTSVLALQVQLTEQLPETLSLSLESLANYFKLPSGPYHTAKFDALTTLEVYKCLRKF